MTKYIAPDARAKRKKQQKAKRLATYALGAILVLTASFGIVKVIEHFTAKQADPPLLDNSQLQQPNTDVQPQGDWETFTGPVQQTINFEIVTPEITMLQVTENGRVDVSYFEDAVFMGDSLADGFRVYAGSTGIANATFLTAKSTSPRSFTQGGYITIGSDPEPVHAFTAVEQKNPKKVYVTLGTNTLNNANVTVDEFMGMYYEFISVLKEKAPNAVIYITTIPPTTVKTAGERPGLTFDRIYQANQAIAKMCNEEGLALINLYEVLKNDQGYLREEIAANDGIHLTPTGYAQWADYIITHTVYSPTSPYIPGSPYYVG